MSEIELKERITDLKDRMYSHDWSIYQNDDLDDDALLSEAIARLSDYEARQSELEGIVRELIANTLTRARKMLEG